MKKYFYIISLLTCIVGFAQESKPTKEQTIAFIKSYFEESLSPCYEQYDTTFITRKIQNCKLNFNSDTSLITFNYDFFYQYINVSGKLEGKTIQHNKLVIDIAKIESVSWSKTNFADCGILYIDLYTVAGYKLEIYTSEDDKAFPLQPVKENKAKVPINAYICKDCDDYESNKKIIQAFNHLRKLCGAPDPIKFD